MKYKLALEMSPAKSSTIQPNDPASYDKPSIKQMVNRKTNMQQHVYIV